MPSTWYPSPGATLPSLFGDGWLRAYFQRGTLGQYPSHGNRFVAPSKVRVFRGRRRGDDLPQPATLALTAAAPYLPLPGDRIDVYVQIPGFHNLFIGEAVSVDTSIGSTVADAPAGSTPTNLGLQSAASTAVIDVAAVDQVARVWRRVIGAQPFPMEDPAQRAARILFAAQATYYAAEFGPDASGDLDVLAQDVDARPAGELLDEIMVTTGSVLRMDFGAGWHYHPAWRRGSVGISAVIPASCLAGPVRWTTDDADRITRMSVSYGSATPQATASAINAQSEVYGTAGGSIDPREVRLTTKLATQAAAQQLADDTVGARSAAQWRLTPLRINMRALALSSPTVLSAVTSLEPESVVEITGMPGVGWPAVVIPIPFPSSSPRVWVVGIEDDIDGPSWLRTLYVEPFERLAQAVQWQQLPNTDQLRWQDVPTWVTWLTSRAWHPYAATTSWSRLNALLVWAGRAPEAGSVLWSEADILVPVT